MIKRLCLLLAAGVFLASSPVHSDSIQRQTVEIVIKHSRFVPGTIKVAPGTNVTFAITNRDPIDHELIIGDEGVQLRHERGSEPLHGDIPGEVTVLAGETKQTTYFFTQPGQLLFGCHYPGHYAYGMRGVILVAESHGGQRT